ncbi:MAG: Protoporphyrinogen dehydrogenase [Pseudomonadota bacterium]|nr:Protoporphyrinogen dehydrogenase [Pseudomonadota bacterium]MDQ1308975.1 Protoporphyrinogen dehydrogenase [Pseudomonadota bacterium]
MADILLLHHGVYGHTRQICERLQSDLVSLGHRADVVPLAGGDADPAACDVVVIGASIRNGKHNPAVVDFIRANRALLESKPSAFFSVNLVARKPAKNTAETNPYVKAFIARSPWKPKLVGVFGGDLDYQRYGFWDRHIIRLIMTITGGPTDLQTKVDYTDWDKVRAFAGQVAAMAPARPS